MRALIAAAVLVSLPVAAQVTVEVEAPKLRFEVAPALVVVAPGVRVVPDYDEEVFVVGSYYYVRRGPHWYRAHGHHGRWHHVKSVPREIVHLPHGKYRHYKPAKAERHGHDKGGHGKHGGGKGSKKGHGGGKGRH